MRRRWSGVGAHSPTSWSGCLLALSLRCTKQKKWHTLPSVVEKLERLVKKPYAGLGTIAKMLNWSPGSQEK